MTSFLFFNGPRRSLARAVIRGEPRSVRFREPRCRFLLLAQVCSTAILPDSPHHQAFAGCVVRIDVHGPKDRAKDASPSADDDLSCLVGCLRFVAQADDVPLLGKLRTSAVIGAFPGAGGNPPRDYGPTEAFVRMTPREGSPSSRKPGCLSPSRRRPALGG
jgi:hypothetical protein